MNREEPGLLTDIRDLPRYSTRISDRKASEWSESPIRSDLGVQFFFIGGCHTLVIFTITYTNINYNSKTKIIYTICNMEP